MESAKLQLDQAVEVREENGRIVIGPVRAAAHDLGALLNAITPETLHGETHWGPDTGREQI